MKASVLLSGPVSDVAWCRPEHNLFHRSIRICKKKYSIHCDKLSKGTKRLNMYVYAWTNITEDKLFQDEVIVDNYMDYLKWEEFEETRENFPPARPIQDVMTQIKGSEVYRVLKQFPKGGNMHLHMSMLCVLIHFKFAHYI